MKYRSKIGLFVVVAAALIFSGCAKPPTQEINDAKEGITQIESQDGTTYAAEELRQLHEDMDAAMEEVKVQDEKFLFKNYEKAKEMLAKLKAEGENVKIAIPKRKEQAKNNALAAQNDARMKIDEAKALLDLAPVGKGSQADIEAFKGDLNGLEESYTEIQKAIDQEKYFAATDHSKIVREKAESISEQVRHALEKVHPHK